MSRPSQRDHPVSNIKARYSRRISARNRILRTGDPYKAYLAVLSWFTLPLYGLFLSVVLPTDMEGSGGGLSAGVLLLVASGAWSGLRGGPLWLTRPSIVHKLLSPSSRRLMLLPQLLRQAAASAAAAALVASLLWPFANPGSFGYGSTMVASGAAGLAAASAIFQAVLWSVAFYDDDRKFRISAFVLVALNSIGYMAALFSGLSFAMLDGIMMLVASGFCGGVFAIVFLNRVSLERLWERSDPLDSMQSAFMLSNFQQVFLSLRQVIEQPKSGSRYSPVSRWLPVPFWRLWVAVRHNLVWHLARLSLFTGIASALYWKGDPSEGLTALAIVGCMFLVGVEISGPISGTARRKELRIHYQSGSGAVLRGQVLVVVAVAITVGLVVSGFGLTGWSTRTVSTVLLSVAAALGATVQARLGEPDLGAMIDRFGVKHLGHALFARAICGPILVLVLTIGIFHMFLHSGVLTILLAAGTISAAGTSFVISTENLGD